MAKRKLPLRKCVVSGEMKTKDEMLRIVRNKEGDVFIDETGRKNGRGAYVSLNPDMVEKAKESQLLEKALKTKIPAGFYEDLFERINYRIARLEIMKQNE